MKRMLSVMAVLAALLIASSTAIAQSADTGAPGGGMMGRGGGRGMGMRGGAMAGAVWDLALNRILVVLAKDQQVQKDLGLSSDQIKKIQAIADKQKSGRAQKPAQGENLRKLLQTDKPDLKKIDKAIDEMSLQRAAEQKRDVRAYFEVRKILTPDQQKKLKTIVQQRISQRMGQGGPGQGAGRRWRGGQGGEAPNPAAQPK